MALLYSQSEWFVPNLQSFTDANSSTTRRCVWHKSRRAPKRDGGNLVRCSCSLGEQDTQRADQLLKDLRNAPDGGQQYLNTLRELSPLLLCRQFHRLSNAGVIFDSWTAEIGTRNHAPETPTQAPKSSTQKPAVHRVTSTEVLEQLGITVGTRTRCHGRCQTKESCGNWINKVNRERIVAIVRELAGNWGLSRTVLNLLEELSGLVMCFRLHQDQASLKLKDWTAVVELTEASRKPLEVIKTTSSPRTPVRQSSRFFDTETPETKASSFWTSPRRPRSPESAVTTPNSSPSLAQTSKHADVEISLRQPKLDRDRERLLESPTPVSSRTRLNAKDAPNRPAAPASESCFEPLPTVKSTFEAACHVMKKIKERISKDELPRGYVYGFRRPGCNLIKIGMTTKTVAERLGSIKAKCHYSPTVVFEISTNHAMKVEHLVHRHLYRNNQRECLVNGVCNNGAGCPARHKEWFAGVSDKEAEAVVRAWVGWINLEPYDKDGCLKGVWITQTKSFALNAQGEIWLQWTKIKLEVKQEIQDEALDAAIMTEKVLSGLLGLSSQVIAPEVEPSVTTTEIRESLSGLPPAVSVTKAVHVSA